MPIEMDLRGSWKALPVARFDGKYDVGNWFETQVPGHWQQTPDLADHVGKVVYRRSFKLYPDPEKRFFVRLCGTFYWATAYLNDARLGANEGYFFPAEYEATGLFRKDNEILVEVDCPAEPDKAAKRMVTGEFHHSKAMRGQANPGGPWLPVEIHWSGPARLRDPVFRTVYIGKGGSMARVSGRVGLDSLERVEARLRISFSPRTFHGQSAVFEKEVVKPAGVQTYEYQLDLPEPALWWTHETGRPDLYTVKVEVFVNGADNPSDVYETFFGARTFSLRDYVPYLNGRPIFLRGANYLPPSPYPGSFSSDIYMHDIESMAMAGLNTARVHAHVAHPDFYRACDRLGVLIWQDFPLQWRYSKEVESQARSQVRRMIAHLGGHPSVAIWCMHNEPFHEGGYSLFAKAARYFSANVYSWESKELDRELAREARSLDPERTVIEGSGAREWGCPKGDAHFNCGDGDSPIKLLARLYRKRPDRLKMISEFGVRSPSPSQAGEDLMALGSKYLACRGRLAGGTDPASFDSTSAFIEAAGKHQGRVIRYIVDRARALKLKPCGGCLVFSWNQPLPGIHWSVTDEEGEPKHAMESLKLCMRPVYAFTIIDREKAGRGDIVKLPLLAVNDLAEKAEVRISAAVETPTAERIIEREFAVTLEPFVPALALATLEFRLRWAGVYTIAIRLADSSGKVENVYTLEAR